MSSDDVFKYHSLFTICLVQSKTAGRCVKSVSRCYLLVIMLYSNTVFLWKRKSNIAVVHMTH